MASRPRRSNAGVADFPIGLPEDASYLQTPNIVSSARSPHVAMPLLTL